ncbi:MAG: hypothetical protein MZV70_03795 [Desulfobacterales bacterium]|nr:hypothetical protein [Desulfobacterales bacterium]
MARPLKIFPRFPPPGAPARTSMRATSRMNRRSAAASWGPSIGRHVLLLIGRSRASARHCRARPATAPSLAHCSGVSGD